MSNLGNCEFCGVELTDFDLPVRSPLDFHNHCRDQMCRNAATHPQIWLLKKKLNKPYQEPPVEERVCAVCNNPLTDKEWNEILSTHVNFTCTLHRRASQDFNTDISRRQYGYSEANSKRLLKEIIKVWGF